MFLSLASSVAAAWNVGQENVAIGSCACFKQWGCCGCAVHND